jgi:hypothetical protein
LKRLDDIGIVDHGMAQASHIRRVARRTIETTNIARYDALPDEIARKQSALSAVLASIEQVSGTPQIERLAKAIPADRERMGVSETLSFFSKRK